jgi:hypothetical protein
MAETRYAPLLLTSCGTGYDRVTKITCMEKFIKINWTQQIQLLRQIRVNICILIYLIRGAESF